MGMGILFTNLAAGTSHGIRRSATYPPTKYSLQVIRHSINHHPGQTIHPDKLLTAAETAIERRQGCTHLQRHTKIVNVGLLCVQ